MTLDQVLVGNRARIKKVDGQGPLRRRLMEMGMIKGVEIEVIKMAPLGDPIEYKILGYHLSLRRTEARWVEVE